MRSLPASSLFCIGMACASATAAPTASSAAVRVHVPAGTFTAGLDPAAREKAMAICRATVADPDDCKPSILHDEQSALPVAVAALAIDRLEVSQQRYRACVAAGVCTPSAEAACRYGDGSTPSAAEWTVLRRGRHPVVCVTFAQAERFCAWAGGRLPTEIEWERAARGDDGRMFPWGDDWRPEALNWGERGTLDGHAATAPVGSYPRGASPYGALDMVGNVWEWARRVDGADDEARAGKQAIRGGGFAAAAHVQRTTKRVPYDARRGYPNVGFRCIATAVPDPARRPRGR